MTHIVDGQPAPAPNPPASTATESQPMHQTAETGQPAKRRPAPRSRDAFFDNAKFLAIILVVAGHVMEDLRDIEALHALYMFIYMFHMPVFIVITGYFSRNFTFSGGKAQKLITNLGVPYVVFEVAYSTFHWAADGAKWEMSLLDPYYLTWFLMALFAWRLSTPVWAQIRWPLAVAVVISLVSGMDDLPRELDMNRMLGMLPYFVLGLMLKPEHFEWLKRPTARVLGAVTMIGGLVVAFLTHRHMATEWAYWRHGNDYLGVDDLTGSAMRLGVLVASAALVAAFLALVPKRHTWFTRFGALTLYTYLLHGFFTKIMEYQGWWDAGWMRTPWGLAVVFLTASTVALLLMTRPVRWITHWAMEPRMPWAFVPPRRPRHSVHQGAHRAAEPRPAETDTGNARSPASEPPAPSLPQRRPWPDGPAPTAVISPEPPTFTGPIITVSEPEPEPQSGSSSAPPLPRRSPGQGPMPGAFDGGTNRSRTGDARSDGPAGESTGDTLTDGPIAEGGHPDGPSADSAVRPPYGLAEWPQPGTGRFHGPERPPEAAGPTGPAGPDGTDDYDRFDAFNRSGGSDGSTGDDRLDGPAER